jgi:hypothetical protein
MNKKTCKLIKKKTFINPENNPILKSKISLKPFKNQNYGRKNLNPINNGTRCKGWWKKKDILPK